MKYNRTYHFDHSPGVTSDDKISSDISNLIGSRIIISEKLDGENTGMVNDGVYARSHATYTTSDWSREVRQLHDIKVRGNLSSEFIFGENLEGIHSIEYSKLESYFYIFGVRDNNIWVPWNIVEEYSYLLDIPLVPVLFDGIVKSDIELKDLISDLVSSPSELGGIKEGVVVRSYGLFHNDDFKKNVIKWVRKDHVQTDSHWTRNWKKAKINK